MNIGEVDMLSGNLRAFYLIILRPHLYVRIGGYKWYLSDGKIMKRSFSYTPQELSERLFYWVND